MNRLAQLASLTVAVAAMASAQPRGPAFGFRGFSPGGFSHGGLIAGAGVRFGFNRGFSHFGFRGFHGFIGRPSFGRFIPPRFVSPFIPRRTYFYPGLFPIYGGYGGGYAYSDPYPYPTAPQVIVIYPPPPPPAPEFIVQRTESPANTDRAPARQDSPYLLIPLKDRTVHSAVAYWIEGETLHFITMRGRHDTVPLVRVDRTLSEELNRGREIPFRLPPER